jgi:hypothetical protein
MRSSDHCRNILAPVYSRIGIGVSRRSIRGVHRGTWTQDFALPLKASPPSRNWGPAYGCPYR